MYTFPWGGVARDSVSRSRCRLGDALTLPPGPPAAPPAAPAPRSERVLPVPVGPQLPQWRWRFEATPATGGVGAGVGYHLVDVDRVKDPGAMEHAHTWIAVDGRAPTRAPLGCVVVCR